MSDAAKKTCFVIAPIGEEGTETRKRSDQILHHVITPAVKECGIEEVVRADGIAEPGIITSQIIQRVIDSELVVADLTGRNPNVYYELALRHAVKKPYIQLIQMGETMPFDVAGLRTISLDHTDLDSVAKCKEEIIRQVLHVQSHPTEIDSPISVSIDLQSLKHSENPVEKMTAEIVNMLQNFQVSMDDKLELMQTNLERKMGVSAYRMQLSLKGAEGLIDEYRALVEAIVESKKLDHPPSTGQSIAVIDASAHEIGVHLSKLLESGGYPVRIRETLVDVLDQFVDN